MKTQEEINEIREKINEWRSDASNIKGAPGSVCENTDMPYINSDFICMQSKLHADAEKMANEKWKKQQ